MDNRLLEIARKSITDTSGKPLSNEDRAFLGLDPITSESITPSSPMNIKQPEPTIVPDINNLDSTFELTKPEKDVQSIGERARELNLELTGEAGYRAEQEDVRGISELEKTQKDLSSQLKALQNEAKAIPLQLQEWAKGRGVTEGGLAPIQTGQLRENAIKALSVSSLLEASRGNLALAYDMVDRAVAAKYNPIRAERDAKLANLEIIINSPEYTKAEQKRALAQKRILDKEEKDEVEKEQKDKKIWEISVDAASSGKIDSLTLQKIQRATTPEEALRLATEAGVFLEEEKNTAGGVGKTTKEEKPLTMWEISEFKRNYGWTPPYGFTQSELEQYMADNPNATPEELERGIQEVMGTTSTLNEDWFRENYTEDELHDLAKKKGIAKWYTPKGSDIKRFFKALGEAIEQGYSDEEIKQWLGI